MFILFFSDELSILPHSQSDPVSLQPTKASDLLLQTVIPEVDEPEVNPTEPIVIEANGPALMQESDECPILGYYSNSPYKSTRPNYFYKNNKKISSTVLEFSIQRAGI